MTITRKRNDRGRAGDEPPGAVRAGTATAAGAAAAGGGMAGEALGEDKGCVPTIPLRVDAGRLYLLRSAVVGERAA